MTSDWWATMWLPRPITQRSPMRSTGTGPRSWPGTMPADRVTREPMSVSVPTAIQRSPKIVPGGKATSDPAPNAANRWPAGVSVVVIPACWTACQPQCTSRQRSSRQHGRTIRVIGVALAGRSGQLTAGAVDLPAAGVADRDRDAVGLQPADELALVGRPGRGPLGARRGVQRDQVDVGQVPGQQGAQQVGPPGLVVG